MSSRVRRVDVGVWADPKTLRAMLLGSSPWQIWLDAGPHAQTGHSYIGTGRTRALTATGPDALVSDINLLTGDARPTALTLFDALRESVSIGQSNVLDESAASSTFRLGWVGWFGYELGHVTCGAPVTREADLPDVCLLWVDRAVEFDHENRRVWALFDEGDDEWERRVREAGTRAASHMGELSPPEGDVTQQTLDPRHVRSRCQPEEYHALVRECLDEIAKGNAYQLCLTNRIEMDYSHPLDAVHLYERLRDVNPSHHGGLLVLGDTSLVSASPEVFLRVTPDGHVTTKPIKGTRPRDENGERDRELARELRDNIKERAENLMIVDLMRNDLSRVCTVGTVTVEKLLDVESYASVHQLVSTIGGDLSPGLTAVDALAACFPAGSMTGAPKRAAMTILHRLERGPRGVYSGVFGYLSRNGSADLAMVIRSIVVRGSHASLGTGGGITSDSDPAAEWEETLVKARPLLSVLGATTADLGHN